MKSCAGLRKNWEQKGLENRECLFKKLLCIENTLRRFSERVLSYVYMIELRYASSHAHVIIAVIDRLADVGSNTAASGKDVQRKILILIRIHERPLFI